MSSPQRSTMADKRPLSPHLGIYKPQISSTLSILHRLSGVALVAGSALLVIWLWTAAYNADGYGALHRFLSGLFGRILLIGWTAAFYYHLCNGIRHLAWDAGYGYEVKVMERTGWLVLFTTLALTALTWGAVLSQ